VKRFAYLSAAVAATVTIVTPTSLGAPGRAGSCGQNGWPATADGSPAVVSNGYYVWHDARGWHLRLRADAGISLTGRVTANAQIGPSSASTTAQNGLKAQGRALSFRFGGTGASQRIDFKAPCASKLSFQLGSTGVVPGNPPRPGSGSATLPVFLGARGQAPTPSFWLQRPALTGITGLILVGPTCPVVTNSCPPAKPGQGTVRIEAVPRSKGGGGSTGQLAKLVQSDQQGNFSTTLPAGHYMLVVEKSPATYPLPKPSVVDVEAGVMSHVTLVLDTGIR
jgi:hypothetical protein